MISCYCIIIKSWIEWKKNNMNGDSMLSNKSAQIFIFLYKDGETMEIFCPRFYRCFSQQKIANYSIFRFENKNVFLVPRFHDKLDYWKRIEFYRFILSCLLSDFVMCFINRIFHKTYFASFVYIIDFRSPI